MTIAELYNALEKAIDCDKANLNAKVVFYNKEFITRNNFSCIKDAVMDADGYLVLIQKEV